MGDATTQPEPRSPWAVLNLPFVVLIRAYQLVLSPLTGGQCRFEPSCSAYGLGAYRTHGPIRATWLTARRVLRCRPGGGSGYDPVPPYRGGRA